VRRIVQRLVPQTVAYRDAATAWKWEGNVIRSDEVNAWCMPGEKVAAFTGLIERLKATDGEPAAVIGHEIAHALRDARERTGRQAATQLTTAIGVAALEIFTGVHLSRRPRARSRRRCSSCPTAARTNRRPLGSASSSPRGPATTGEVP
jgi:Zn-dependent protease with chaperone function